MSSVNSSKRKGVKITNEASTLPTPKQNPTTVFNEQAEKAFNKNEEYKARSFELGTKFRGIVEDKVLAENKTLINKEIEQETLNKLVILANEMNADDNQPEGIGGAALGMLLMKMLISQRDRINTLEYKLDKLEKIVANLKAELLAKATQTT